MDRPTIKDKSILTYVEYLEKQLEGFTRSPYVDTYVTMKGQIDDFNKQLTIGEKIEKTNDDGLKYDFIPGKIDLFASKDSKEFDRAYKYLNDAVSLNENLDKLRRLLTPEETKKADFLIKNKHLGLAEKLALKTLDGE